MKNLHPYLIYLRTRKLQQYGANPGAIMTLLEECGYGPDGNRDIIKLKNDIAHYVEVDMKSYYYIAAE